jgi:hypothetical protein
VRIVGIAGEVIVPFNPSSWFPAVTEIMIAGGFDPTALKYDIGASCNLLQYAYPAFLVCGFRSH